MGSIDRRRLQDLLAAEPFVAGLHLVETTGSTNDEALRLVEAGAPEGTVVLADEQTAGRGRLGRPWHSPPGIGLYLSVVLRPVGPVPLLTRWTIAAAVAACEACREVSGCEVAIKWPNDLLVGSRKVAGILSELRTLAGGPAGLVVGIGINANHAPEDFPHELKDRSTSLRIARGGTSVDRERLAASCLTALGRLSATIGRGGWEEVSAAWARLSPGAHGRSVRIVPEAPAGAEPFEGETRGLDPTGALLVEKSTGEIVRVHQAESVLEKD